MPKSSLTREAAVAAIKKHGMLLVFPVGNASDPASLWSVAYPRSKMRWEWDESGDGRVADLWHLREELSRCREVIYTKWYKGRATFFSRTIFTAMLARLSCQRRGDDRLPASARDILEVLESDSPLSTKALKKATGLQGRANEATYARALKELWTRLLIVGFGEVDEGAFPSLALGSTKVLFEELHARARSMSQEEATEILASFFKSNAQAGRFYERACRSAREAAPKNKGRAVVEYEW